MGIQDIQIQEPLSSIGGNVEIVPAINEAALLPSCERNADQERVMAMQEAGKSVMNALKEQGEGLSILPQGSFFLGLRSGKLPVQLVQLPPKSTPVSRVGGDQRNPTPKEIRRDKESTNWNTNSTLQFRSITLPVERRMWSGSQMHNVAPTTFARNDTQRRQGNNTAQQQPFRFSGEIPPYQGSLSRADTMPFRSEIFSRPSRISITNPMQRAELLSNQTSMERTLLGSSEAFQSRSVDIARYLQGQELPSTSKRAMLMTEKNVFDVVETPATQNCVSTVRHREQIVKFPSDGKIQMTIPFPVPLTGILSRQEQHRDQLPIKPLKSLPIAKTAGNNCLGPGSISHIANKQTNIVRVPPSQKETMNLLTDDDEMGRPSRIAVQCPLTETMDCQHKEDGEGNLVQQSNSMDKNPLDSSTSKETRKSNCWEESLETMQPLLAAIEVMQEEERQKEDADNVVFALSSKIKKGKRTKHTNVKKNGWKKNAHKWSLSLQERRDSYSDKKIQESLSEPKLEESKELRNCMKRQSEVSDYGEKSKRKKANPSFCRLDKLSLGLSKAADYSPSVESDDDNENKALWRFLAEGRSSENLSEGLISEKKIKPLSCISIILSDAALTARNNVLPQPGDPIWTKVKTYVDGMSQEDLQFIIRKYSLCGFSAALLTSAFEACSHQ